MISGLFLCIFILGQVDSGTSALVFDESCGESRGCYHDCDDNGCTFKITWRYVPWMEAIDFTMEMILKDPFRTQWFAMGFSEDKLMGGDSVIECVTDTISREWADVRHSYNDNYYNVHVSHPKYGLRMMSGTSNNGILACNFTRLINVNGDDKIYSLDKPWYLMVTNGFMKDGTNTKLRHEIYPNGPCVTTQEVNFKENINIYTGRDNYIVKIHGCMMIVAWMFLASLSIILARYYKHQWPEGRACGRRVWYQSHKIMMLTVCACVLASFILIWVHTKGLPKLYGTNSMQKAHPTLGIIIMGLTIINPIMAFLRPGNGTANRPVFKYVHGFIGTALYVLAILNIILGVTLPKVGAKSYTVWIVVAFGIYVVIFEIIMETHECYLIRTGRKSDYEMTEMSVIRNSLTKIPQPPGSLLKNIFICLHFIILSGFTVTSVYLIIV
ncbi:DOMON domain-containing protein frrs1L [Mactra antiquata]